MSSIKTIVVNNVTYDIEDAKAQADLSNLSEVVDGINAEVSTKANKATTLVGYGITDAATSAQGEKADSAVQSVKIGETEYKSGNTVTLPEYPSTLPASDVTDIFDAEGTVPVSGKAVAAALSELPEPMVFKGSLGTDGTITTLPSASKGNTGYTYKVITDGTYAGQEAKVGDTFISDGKVWTHIPSGDEPSGTVTSVAIKMNGEVVDTVTSSGTIDLGTVSRTDTTYSNATSSAAGLMSATDKSNVDKMATFLTGTLAANSTSLTISDDSISADSIVDIYTSIYGVNPKTVSVVNGSINMTFKAQASAMNVKVRCM